MSSPVGGTPIGAQEAADLLRKLITESRRVNPVEEVANDDL
jgi:hypothetical protein